MATQHPSIKGIVVLAGDITSWEKELEVAKSKDRAENNPDRDQHLCKCQLSQASRGRIIATLNRTIYGWSVRLGNLQNNAFVTPRGGKYTYQQAVDIGVAWVNQDPTKRALYSFKVDGEFSELLQEAHERG